MTIVVKDEEPTVLSPRRLPHQERDIVRKQVKGSLRDQTIQSCESQYANPVVVSYKKCGNSSIYIDYRVIIKQIVKDRYPLPLIED